ncbi:MAG: hypothetical protein TREMPRED_005716 [Tremellales sp. Tagirdzhanova-0007]|nr:MAG: hypothetical protein TREMPRED_005716 [Tremellales sp. Tagirdzhanova-0007]
MTVKAESVILTSRPFPGNIPSSRIGNIAWSDDGQCLFVTRKGVNIMTPHLTSSITPPTRLMPDPSLEYSTAVINQTKRKSKARERAETGAEGGVEDEVDRDHRPRSGYQLRRPKQGELLWHNTGIEIDGDGGRSRMYGWTEVGAGSSGAFVDKEAATRAANWSPSAVNDLGGSLLVVMTSLGQVSVYAPRNDPLSKQWDEIADLTAMTRRLLSPTPAPYELTVPGMLEMRATSMEWSRHVPLPSMLGIDGSLLALASRSGRVALWSYGVDKRFSRVVHEKITEGWVAHMAWSDWKIIDDKTCEADLAFALIDGSVSLLRVRRKALQTDMGLSSWNVEVEDPRMLDCGDKRAITALQWIEKKLVVWAKPGSIHLWSEIGRNGVMWDGVRSVRLQRVGNWASANALGISQTRKDQLLITLSSLTHHIITDIFTSPQLGPDNESLRLSVASREAFLEFTHGEVYSQDRYRMPPREHAELTAFTSGWPINFYNLDSVSDGHRVMNLFVTDENAVLPGSQQDPSFLDNLEDLLRRPPSLLHIAPIALLMPYMLRVLASVEPAPHAQRLLEICSKESDAPSEPGRATAIAGQQAHPDSVELLRALWGNQRLDAERIRLVLSQWCKSHFDEAQDAFESLNKSISLLIQRRMTASLIRWVGSKATAIDFPKDSLDRRFILLLIKSAYLNEAALDDLSEEITRLSGICGADQTIEDQRETTGMSESCPACEGALSFSGPDITLCGNGHRWCK